MARFWEDVEVGMELPRLVKSPTSKEEVMWAGATGQLGPVHYDKDNALSRGFLGPILHGDLGMAYLGQLMTDWIGTEGVLKRLSVRYRAVGYTNDTLTCMGRVIEKQAREGENLVECEIWLENGKGEKITLGSATVSLPSRQRKK